MADDDPMNLELSDAGFEQRYIMALFYFSMDGPQGVEQNGWLSELSECLVRSTGRRRTARQMTGEGVPMGLWKSQQSVRGIAVRVEVFERDVIRGDSNRYLYGTHGSRGMR